MIHLSLVQKQVWKARRDCSVSRYCLRLWRMELTATGVRRQQNALLYCCPESPKQHVVYFQGDVQNLLSVMQAQQETVPWQDWCLENTLSILQRKFPEAAIWIVRPSRMLRSMFSCFHNFVQSSLIGVPTYTSTYGCLLQLEALLKDAVQRVIRRGELDMDVRAALDLPVVVVGFSKGCVVLNQIIHELVNYVVPVIQGHALYRSRQVNLSQSTPTISIHTPLQGQRSHPSSPAPTRVRLASPETRRRRESPDQAHTPDAPTPHRLTAQRSTPDVRIDSGHEQRPLSAGSRSHDPGGWSHDSGESRSRLSSTSSTRSERGCTPEVERPMKPFRSSSFGAAASKHIITPTQADIRNLTVFLRRVKALYWLDAGHSGGHGAWVTDTELLSMLVGLGVEVFVHVTPQQVSDPHRVWIGEEEREFVDKLRAFGAMVHETVHFEQEERSLENHFKVLTEF